MLFRYIPGQLASYMDIDQRLGYEVTVKEMFMVSYPYAAKLVVSVHR